MMETAPNAEVRIALGVSACLLGESVRWDGGHKRDHYVADVLPRFFDFVPVCPEVAIGLGAPRKPLRLVGTPEVPRAVDREDASRDVTEPLVAYGRQQAHALCNISGYILKRASPSCGMERVKVFSGHGGRPVKRGVGIYARAMMTAVPLLPVEEEGRLNDHMLRDNFIERIFAYRRWQDLMQQGLTAARLVVFHQRHKLALMAHGAEPARRLGRLVAAAGYHSQSELATDYGTEFMAVLCRIATRKTHTNVLSHIMGYFSRELDADDKAELAEAIESYRLGHVPRVAPFTLLKNYQRRFPSRYLADQIYLSPSPAELVLRNSL